MNTQRREGPDLIWLCIMTDGGRIQYIEPERGPRRKPGSKTWDEGKRQHIARLLFVNNYSRPEAREKVMKFYAVSKSSADTIVARIYNGQIKVKGFEQRQGQ